MHVPYKSALGIVALAAAAFAVVHWRSADQSRPAAAAPPPRSRSSPRRCSSTTSQSCFLALERLGAEYGLDPEPGDGRARAGQFYRRPDGQEGRHPRQDRPASLPGGPGAGARTIGQGHRPSRPGGIGSRALSKTWDREFDRPDASCRPAVSGCAGRGRNEDRPGGDQYRPDEFGLHDIAGAIRWRNRPFAGPDRQPDPTHETRPASWF